MASVTQKDKDIHEGKFFAIIAYISFFCIVSLILKKENKFAVFHGKQGLVLFVLEVICFVVSILPLIGDILKVAGGIIFTLASLWGIIQALKGNFGRIALISDIADRIVL